MKFGIYAIDRDWEFVVIHVFCETNLNCYIFRSNTKFCFTTLLVCRKRRKGAKVAVSDEVGGNLSFFHSYLLHTYQIKQVIVVVQLCV